MKQYDFRFNLSLIKSFVGKKLTKYKHADFIYTNSVTGVLGFEVDNCIYELTNDYEAFDFLTLDDEATVFRISKTEWKDAESLMNNDINETSINEKIQKIILINDHTILSIDHNLEYDMWDTKAIVFYFKDYEICFVKQDCWFSQEIEIYKGYNLIEKCGDGKDILEDFNDNDSKSISVERNLIEVE